MKTRQDALTFACGELEKADVPNSAYDSRHLLAYVLGISPFTLSLSKNQPITPVEIEKYLSFIQKRANRVPLQYLTKEQYFMGRPFYVDSSVLIPRGETELLCEQALLTIKSFPKKEPVVLDLCTGSGVLAVTIALECPFAKVHGCDISSDALAVATKNASSLNSPVTFHQGDFLQAVNGLMFHLIVSNPPYIPKKDLSTLQQEVSHEPMLALDGGEDGLDFYRLLALQGRKYLYDKGIILCEIGYNQGDRVSALFSSQGYCSVKILPDLQGFDRILIAEKPSV
ncbi:MAG: peptide chain release factor N(5)-glutamine methyltransferase [Clostridiales bacterium]|nr:peptide chain release factor N(5)-glutamine methyltransferase [Clostridiales bacterium]